MRYEQGKGRVSLERSGQSRRRLLCWELSTARRKTKTQNKMSSRPDTVELEFSFSFPPPPMEGKTVDQLKNLIKPLLPAGRQTGGVAADGAAATTTDIMATAAAVTASSAAAATAADTAATAAASVGYGYGSDTKARGAVLWKLQQKLQDSERQPQQPRRPRVAEATVADPAPAPAVADPEERQRDQVELEKETE